MFLLVVDVHANKKRINKEYGIEIELTEDKKEYVQITQLADDTSIFAKTTEGLWLGRKIRMNNLAGLNWNQEEVKALGVYFGYDKKEIEKKNWQKS